MRHSISPSRCCFSPMGLPGILALAVLLALAGACSRNEPTADEAIFTPEAFATTDVPLSQSDQVALLADERVACVVDSYETRVHCVDAEGAVVGVFGRAGEGPGEFGGSGNPGNLGLVRGEEGTVGVYDGALGRFTVFEPSGTYVSDVPTPFLDPLRSFGTVLSGVVWRGWIADSLMTRYDVNIATGEVVREEASPSGRWGVACGEGEVIDGIPDRASGWVFVACGDRLVFAGDNGDATVVPVPTHLPDERDVARLEERLLAVRGSLHPEVTSRALQGSSEGTYRSFVDESLEGYRGKPKPYSLGEEHRLFDAANRYWIATQRDTHEWSYLDVYENAEYVGSVRVRDRLRAFDLLGSTLVVLVERQAGPDDADGVPDRELDWYDIGELPFGR
ncbi:MAG: hypothetical protein F4139_08095 [Gemmatimonadetes bacterium]|nr:hypothetical protein [Gemmatimonadota bacterium]MYH52897.1 hypothetical protein [Gemmatimonadota bacterium]MYK67316.1 hypothetical protein [Gemmatimonadota bacterium]